VGSRFQAIPGTHRVEDALQRGAVVGTPATRMTETPQVLWDQRFQPSPQLVGQDLLAHAMILESCLAGKADTPAHFELIT
jgi:hypothetical protein